MDGVLDNCIAAFPTNCSNDINFSNRMLLKIDAKYRNMINEENNRFTLRLFKALPVLYYIILFIGFYNCYAIVNDLLF